ncbi:LysR family transcriptional regulator [Salidesulfovibrio onnuriiensis]|uniref:LysR family transcriptional regulator n=1 Tax=Salidesulfovibrio onnuriiensis TaxID=2583823 RepID=UPI00164F4892|nr:LysR family transcriptional regulator [Salidesulfovibrio onnuriiensis]
MEFRHLKTFSVVARHLNFTRASVELHYAQSSVSAQIQALEDDLGVKLFDRIGKRIVLTEAGERLWGYARRMLDMTEEIRAEVAESGEARGSLTMRVPETLSAFHLVPVLEEFHKEYPRVRVTFIPCDDSGLREELNTGAIDLAFLMTDDVTMDHVNVRMLGTERLVLAASPGHRLAGLSEVRPEDMEGETRLMCRADCRYRKPFEALLRDGGVSTDLLQFSNLRVLKACLDRAMGFTIIPERTIRADLASGRYVELPWTGDYNETSIIMIWHSEKWRSPVLRSFMDRVEKTFSTD